MAPHSIAAHGNSFAKPSIQVLVTLHIWVKSRPLNLVGILAFLGLAACVFTWGLQYKLSLYDPPQATTHQIPKAKLLSRDEQPGPTESPLVVRTKASSRVIYTVPAAMFFILSLVLGMLNSPASGQRGRRVNRSWHLRHATLNAVFVRPPPILV